MEIKKKFSAVIINDEGLGAKQLHMRFGFFIIMRLENFTGNGLYQGTVFSIILVD
jgi:hypothetical protein